MPQASEDLAVIDALQTVSCAPNQKKAKEKIRRFEVTTTFIPIITAIVVSFVGWMFESLSTVDSLNYSNLICFVIFLPIFIYNDQYTNVRKQQKGLHTKDMLILSIKDDPQTD